MTSRNYDKEYKNFLKAVYKRAGRRCSYPQCRKCSHLQVHHITTWANMPSARFNPDNGIPLCKYHHNMVKGKEYIWADFFRAVVEKQKHDNTSGQ